MSLLVLTVLLLLLGPLSVIAFGSLSEREPWWSADRESAGIVPTAADETRAVVQVYGARTLGWRGAFAIHTWIATKERDALAYRIHHVIGWRYYRGGSALVSQTGAPDFKWFGSVPELFVDERGAHAEAMIEAVNRAVDTYPYEHWYRVWPGPNSNTFTAWVARQVPGLRLDLPATAIGKDFLGVSRVFGVAPSGTGWQLSLFGLAGLTVAKAEGLEINVLGLSAGIDIDDLALRLPGLGRVSFW